MRCRSFSGHVKLKLQQSHSPPAVRCNGGVERVNLTMAQMLAMPGNQKQDDRLLQLSDVKFAYNNSVRQHFVRPYEQGLNK